MSGQLGAFSPNTCNAMHSVVAPIDPYPFCSTPCPQERHRPKWESMYYLPVVAFTNILLRISFHRAELNAYIRAKCLLAAGAHFFTYCQRWQRVE